MGDTACHCCYLQTCTNVLVHQHFSAAPSANQDWVNCFGSERNPHLIALSSELNSKQWQAQIQYVVLFNNLFHKVYIYIYISGINCRQHRIKPVQKCKQLRIMVRKSFCLLHPTQGGYGDSYTKHTVYNTPVLLKHTCLRFLPFSNTFPILGC